MPGVGAPTTPASTLPRQAGELGLLAQAFNQLIEDVQSREAALTESESRARLALEAGQMGAWWFDPQDRRTGLSPQAARLLGLPPDRTTLGYDEWFDLLHPDDRAPTLAALELARSGSAGYETEYGSGAPKAAGAGSTRGGGCLPESDWGSGRVIGIFQDVTARRQADEEQDLLLNELNHRVKNTLATVQSIAQQTLRTTSSPDEFREAFEARLLALSKTHDLLTRDAWRSADLVSLVGQEMAPYARDGEARVVVAGPGVRLPARVAINLGLVVHELATNAAKYGALSVPTGRVTVGWSLAGTEEARTALHVERSGRPAGRAAEAEGVRDAADRAQPRRRAERAGRAGLPADGVRGPHRRPARVAAVNGSSRDGGPPARSGRRRSVRADADRSVLTYSACRSLRSGGPP